MGKACNGHEKGCSEDQCPACILAEEKEAIRRALKGLMEAHREAFSSSLFASFQGGKTSFVDAWKLAERYAAKPPAQEPGMGGNAVICPQCRKRRSPKRRAYGAKRTRVWCDNCDADKVPPLPNKTAARQEGKKEIAEMTSQETERG